MKHLFFLFHQINPTRWRLMSDMMSLATKKFRHGRSLFFPMNLKITSSAESPKCHPFCPDINALNHWLLFPSFVSCEQLNHSPHDNDDIWWSYNDYVKGAMTCHLIHDSIVTEDGLVPLGTRPSAATMLYSSPWIHQPLYTPQDFTHWFLGDMDAILKIQFQACFTDW